MEQNPHSLDTYFRQFGVISQHELIELKEYLATIRIAAINAHDVTHVAIIEALFNRAENLLERIEQREMKMVIRATEYSSVN